jgi:hypothetical protein
MKNWRKYPKVRKKFTRKKKIPKNSQVVLLKKKKNCPSPKKHICCIKFKFLSYHFFLKMVVVIFFDQEIGFIWFLVYDSYHFSKFLGSKNKSKFLY